MLSLMPSGSPEEVMDALLDVIRNPELAKKHLDLLTAKKKAADEALKSVHEAMETAAEATRKAAEDKQAAATLLADVKRQTQAMTAKHESRGKELLSLQEALDGKQKQLEQREEAVAAREAAVSDRDADVTSRESDLAKLESEVRAMKADYEQKVAALQAVLK